MRVLTLNTGGLSSPRRLHAVMEDVKRCDGDIVLLQETNFTRDVLSTVERDAHLCNGFAVFATPAPRRGSGVAVMVSHNILRTSPVLCELIPGFAASIDLVLSDRVVRVVNVYIPHDENIAIQVLRRVRSHLSNFAGEVILGGDFNCTLDPAIDRHSRVEFHPGSADRLRDLVSSCDLVDLFRWKYPARRAYTRISQHPHGGFSGSRIDRLYVSRSILATFTGVTHEVCSMSDHFMVVATSTIIEKRTAYWIFNNNLLMSDQFKEELTSLWHRWRERKGAFSDLSQWWDIGKLQIRSLIESNFSRSRYRASTLSKEVARVGALLPQNPDMLPYYESIKRRLQAQNYRHSLEFILRNQSRWTREGESPTHFFFQATRRRTASVEIGTLIHRNGQVLHGQEVAEHIREFYTDLYSRPFSPMSEDTNRFLRHVPTLSDESRDMLDTRLGLQDLMTATKDLNRGTSPGYDGLTPEFFIAFRDLLIPDLLEVFNSAADGLTDFPLSWRRSVMRLIPKKGDLQRIENWRPVTLCNVDYKIVCKAIGLTLNSVMSSIIGPEQSYCVPGRSIHDNIAVAKHLVDYCNRSNVPMAMVSLDQHKAFDSVSHEYLLTVLDAFGFPPRFIGIIRGLYGASSALIKHQGQILSPIPFRRGIRQGCPLSGMLYDVSVEPLLVNLRRELEECAVRLPYVSIRPLVLAYADDLSLFLARDEGFPIARAVFEQFERSAGAKVNLTKSHGLWCGSWRGRMDAPLGIQWTDTRLKYLGVYIGCDATARNRHTALEKVSGAISAWQSRLFHFSLKGRAVVLNYVVASSIVHILKADTPGEDFLRTLQVRVTNAFWCGRHWVAESTVCAPVSAGGLGLVDLVVRAKCFQVRALQRVFCRRDTLISQLWIGLFTEYGRGLGDNFFLLRSRPPYPPDWPWDLTYTVQTWNRLRPEFQIDWNSMGYTQFSQVPLRLNLDLSDALIGSARGFDAGMGNLAVLGDVIDISGNVLVPADTPVLRGVVSAARERFRQISTSNPGSRMVDSLVLRSPPHTSFGGLTSRSIRGVFVGLNPPRFAGLLRWRAHLGVDPGATGGITARVFYSYPTRYKDADVAFKLLHHSLAHPNQLSHIDRRVQRTCTVCAGEGSLFHRFFACPALQELMELVGRLSRLISPSFGTDRLSFLIGPRTCSGANRLLSFVLCLVKSTVHLYYMRAGQGNQEQRDLISHRSALKRHLVARLQKRMRLEYLVTETSAFNATWSPLGFVRDGTLMFGWQS